MIEGIDKMARRELLMAAAALPLAGAFAARGAFASPRVPEPSPGLDADEAAIRAAFFYGFPLYEFARVEQTLGQGMGRASGLNTVTRRAQLSGPESRNVTAPNNDTVYASSFLELSGGPVEVSVPTIPDRYFSIAFMDAFTDNFAYVGTRATKGRGGRFWIAGPQWRGRAPSGVRVLRSSTNDVWMLGRILVEGPGDLPAAAALLEQVRVSVPGAPREPRGYTARATTGIPDPANFLAVVNEVLRRSPGGLGQTARAARFRSQGIGADKPSPELLARWAAFFPKGYQELREGFLFRDLVVGGWTYQARGVGDFGSNDRLRALVALGGIAALSEKEAMYFHANFDGAGQQLTGATPYRWRVPPGGVPARAFWSLTMYDPQPDGRYFLVENPLNRYSIGDRTPGLVYEPDGSLIVPIQHERPEGRLAPNWLPAPKGPMRLALRAYLPKPELQARKWRVPPLEQAAP
ncbi:DUF1254 domain-containing protein [Sphingomonas canadensis]|uniref:DUF1254 domain-containing protein n=1 Tax=Sphingomonas canadensis TaxID=1219257 RepID=A0ABW3H2E2_9SPHN|nr:DUF1254 domain-containing protein [Sphingomonas canadensis]MCW3834449.1 DUF1254 domain-containing protein [Sphingomonas canadensis]